MYETLDVQITRYMNLFKAKNKDTKILSTNAIVSWNILVINLI